MALYCERRLYDAPATTCLPTASQHFTWRVPALTEVLAPASTWRGLPLALGGSDVKDGAATPSLAGLQLSDTKHRETESNYRVQQIKVRGYQGVKVSR